MPATVRELVKEGISKRKIKRRRFWVFSITFLIIVTVGGLGYLFQQPSWQISGLSLEPDLLPYKPEIKKIINDNLSGRWFYILPKSSVLVVNKKVLARQISEANPQLTFVSVAIDGQVIIVGGENRHPTALLCNGGEQCYFIDQRGIIYEAGPTAAYYVLPIFRSDFQNINLPTKLLAPMEYQSLLDTASALNQKAIDLNLTNKHYSYINLSGDDVFLNFKTGLATSTDWQLKFTLATKGESLVKYLETLTQVKSFKDQLGKGNLSLIDLRFKPKVYYRFK